jgi:hypothetical protein
VKRYEYIRLEFDVNDLKELNGLSSVGFRVVAVIDERITGRMNYLAHFALLERELPADGARAALAGEPREVVDSRATRPHDETT